MVTAVKNKDINLDRRDAILDYENQLSNVDGAIFGDSAYCPLKHTFSDGIYVREIMIPAGTVLTGKIHKHEHPNFLMKGSVEVFTEADGYQILEAPLSMISKPGTKRVVKALTDVIWITVHLNQTNTQDLDLLEKDIIAKDYYIYNKFIESKNSTLSKLKSFIVKLLTK